MTSENRKKAEAIIKLAGIKEIPVDIRKIADALKIKVVEYPFPEKLSGKVTVVNGQMIIGVNKNHPEVRQRYTIAHEIGHFVNGHQHYQKTYVEDDKRFFDPHFHQEKEADIFAGELLMPKSFLEDDVRNIGTDIQELAKKYNVSVQAMTIRLTSSGLLNKYSFVNEK